AVAELAIERGRGTDRPFEVIGGPAQPATRPYQFTPRPNAASPSPPLNGQLCYGLDLHQPAPGQPAEFFTLSYLLDFYQNSTDKSHFFRKYFEELVGTDSLRAQVIAGRSEASIRASWEPRLGQYKALRKKYLLYPEK
ncbi:MAG: DUF1343 domain-containing protein, partial [Hymenobacter sp.]